MQSFPIQYADGTSNEVNIYSSPTNTNKVIAFFPALGVRASYYIDFAKALSASGIHVCITDWRGQGKSSIRASRKVNYGYKELLEDMSELIDFLEEHFPNSKKYIMGHSLGGQLGSLFSSRFPGKLAGLIHIASCMVYFKGWEGMGRFRIWMAVNFFPILSKIVGYFPGDRIGFGGREARRVMKDWSYNGRQGKYKVAKDNFDYEAAIAQNDIPVLSMSLSGDSFAPPKAVNFLLKKFSTQAPIQYEHISPEAIGVSHLNHFNWAKNPNYFVKVIGEWIKKS